MKLTDRDLQKRNNKDADSDPAVQESLLECVLRGGFIVLLHVHSTQTSIKAQKKAQRNKLCFFQMP